MNDAWRGHLRAGAKKPRTDEVGTPEGRGPGWPEFTSPLHEGIAPLPRKREHPGRNHAADGEACPRVGQYWMRLVGQSSTPLDSKGSAAIPIPFRLAHSAQECANR